MSLKYKLSRLWFDTSEHTRFLIIGAYNTAFGYALFATVYLCFSSRLHYLILAVLSHFLAVINAFAGHRWLVFRSRGPLLFEFIRFNISYLGLLSLGLVGISILVEIIHLHVLVAQACMTVATVIVSYFANRNFTFRSRAQS